MQAEKTLRIWDLAKRLAHASDDELAVIERIVERLDRGREVYGALDLASDERDFTEEGRDELIDFVVYARMDELRALRMAEGRGERVEYRPVVPSEHVDVMRYGEPSESYRERLERLAGGEKMTPAGGSDEAPLPPYRAARGVLARCRCDPMGATMVHMGTRAYWYCGAHDTWRRL